MKKSSLIDLETGALLSVLGAMGLFLGSYFVCLPNSLREKAIPAGMLLLGLYLLTTGVKLTRGAFNILKQRELGTIDTNYRTVEDRLDELERLKRRDLVTPEEYAAKRQDILKDL